MPLLSPVAPTGQWLERVFLSPWLRWDVEWYQRIVTEGYSAIDGTAQFHPLYPWLATPLTWVGISPILSLLVVSALSAIALFYCFKKLALLNLPPTDASYALLLLAFVPPAFILFAPYPEALFLLLTVLCFYYARRKSWWLAGMIGGLATLTRQQGIFLLIPMTAELWESSRNQPANFLKRWRDWLGLILIPTGYIAWLVYRAFFLSDWRLNFGSFHEFVYSFFISPSAAQVVPEQKFTWPWQTLSISISRLITQPDIDLLVNISISMVFLVLLVFSWKYMRMSYRLYSLTIMLISFSYYTGAIHPYMGLPRHLFLAFPVYLGSAALIRNPWLRVFSIGLCTIGLSFLVVIYVTETWVP